MKLACSGGGWRRWGRGTTVRRMPFVYHGVPRGMVGEVIYPLNELAEIAPDVYELQKAKYDGREAVLEFRVPNLEVLFNDTVHCAPLHPYHLFAARSSLGLDPPRTSSTPRVGRFSGLFFEIPLERIVPHPTVWYQWKQLWINGAPDEDVPLVPPLDEFEPFDASRYRELPDVTDAHMSYLRRRKQQGKPPLLFVHIPHVLVAGPIATHGLRVIPWDEAPRAE